MCTLLTLRRNPRHIVKRCPASASAGIGQLQPATRIFQLMPMVIDCKDAVLTCCRALLVVLAHGALLLRACPYACLPAR